MQHIDMWGEGGNKVCTQWAITPSLQDLSPVKWYNDYWWAKNLNVTVDFLSAASEPRKIKIDSLQTLWHLKIDLGSLKSPVEAKTLCIPQHSAECSDFYYNVGLFKCFHRSKAVIFTLIESFSVFANPISERIIIKKSIKLCIFHIIFTFRSFDLFVSELWTLIKIISWNLINNSLNMVHYRHDQNILHRIWVPTQTWS